MGELKGAGPASLGPGTGWGHWATVCPLYSLKRKPAREPDTDSGKSFSLARRRPGPYRGALPTTPESVMRLVPLFALLILTSPAVAAEPFFFQKGDRVLFLGDSITEQYQYSTDIELYLTTRFPDWNLTFLNAGIGGDTAAGGAGRFREHVLNEKPTALTIDFGMNDGGYGKFDPARNKQYVEKTAAMLDMAKKAGVRVALISPNAVDRRGRENFKLYVETQKAFYAPLKDLAAHAGVPFVDQYAVTRAALEKMERDRADKVNPFGDGVHTTSAGGLLMAHTILTGLGAPPRYRTWSSTPGRSRRPRRSARWRTWPCPPTPCRSTGPTRPCRSRSRRTG